MNYWPENFKFWFLNLKTMIPLKANGSTSFVPPLGEFKMGVQLKDPKTGNFLPFVVAKEASSKRLRALGMIRHDLEQAEKNLSEAIRRDFDDITELMWHSAVIGYGRCFVQAKGRGTSLEVTHVNEAGKQYLQIHKKLMEIRHQYVAHSGENEQQQAFILIPLFGESNAPEIKNTFFTTINVMSPTKEILGDFLLLIRDLKKVVEQIFAKNEKIVMAHYAAKSPDELRRLADKGIAG